jgi:hypothetical protein
MKFAEERIALRRRHTYATRDVAEKEAVSACVASSLAFAALNNFASSIALLRPEDFWKKVRSEPQATLL